MAFWVRLNDLMEKNNLSQRDMEKITGLRQPSISRWQTGILPKSDIAVKIAKYFNVSVEYLIDGIGEGKDREILLTGETEEKTEIIHFKISSRLKKRINAARLAGAFCDEAESTFMSYLLNLGIEKYQKNILPVEQGEDEEQGITVPKKAS